MGKNLERSRGKAKVPLFPERSSSWRRRGEVSKHSGSKAARPGLCIYLPSIYKAAWPWGPHTSTPMLPSGVASASSCGAPTSRGVIFLQEVRQLPADEAGGPVHFAHVLQQAEHQGPAALLALAPGLSQLLVAVVVCLLGWAQGSPAAQGAAMMGTVLAVLPVLSQGPTRHPRHAAFIGADHQLEGA